MNISEHLSELEALRKERGMSQQELAETCGVSKATICRALNGATEPTGDSDYGHFHCGAGNLPSRLAHLRYHAPGNRMDSEVR